MGHGPRFWVQPQLFADWLGVLDETARNETAPAVETGPDERSYILPPSSALSGGAIPSEFDDEADTVRLTLTARSKSR